MKRKYILIAVASWLVGSAVVYEIIHLLTGL